MTKRINILLALLLILIGAPLWYLFIDSSSARPKSQAIDIETARRLVAGSPGQKPVRLAFSILSYREAAGNYLAAGSGFREQKVGVFAFRLDVPGAAPIMIDTGLTPAYARELGMKHMDAREQARVDAGLRSAGLILATSEEPDHLGGLAALSSRPEGAAILAKAVLNRFQVPGAPGSGKLGWAAGARVPVLIVGQAPQLVAPGVVVLPAPGHSPGTQMIYVQLANGSEILFAGDVAPREINWEERRPPARIMTDFVQPQDRKAISGWLFALHQLDKGNPRLSIVPGHDLEWLIDTNNHTPMVPMRDEAIQNAAGK